ncbi:DUF7386 family protein [Natrinema limicola]|uniref:Uncharacterized protein n=1 Tax=Natrinema limicola JCM 13563 TaxID=1230457 RepID=M0CPT8_9EURY|nr:hypothetical protein [Natrinema limicola]ELZ25280.1 hypothetical protein C476_02532 [Natrinema limicola JCM 13563]
MFKRANAIVAENEYDDPPMTVVIDAALTRLIKSGQNIDDARGEFDPETIQAIANTSVIGRRYRTSIESK